jgi:chemotaxis protein CheD
MKLPGPKLPQVHLRPGELLVTQEPQWIVTVLGSCVAVTMFSVRLRLAAICHGMLPSPHGRGMADSNPNDAFRYLSMVIPAMAERFAHAGIKPSEIEVKMFGGGNVINLGGEPSGERWIGSANVITAQQLLATAGLRIRVQNTGGEYGCKIVFNTRTGEVLHKYLPRRATQT